ncbi:MAG: response regulator transcription factor [Nitrospinae bacterium]|nr:response regulator transcription factor [Nitrospinota bacterium]
MKLLLVEDDPSLGRKLKDRLAAEGFTVDIIDNGADAAQIDPDGIYDAVILDLGLPGKPGLSALADWRRRGARVPVLILTARNAWNERVEGFKHGADDYLGKPFHVEELVERIKAVIRRSHSTTPGEKLSAAGLTLDEERQCVTMADGSTETLTGVEFRLLRYFMLNPGKVLARSSLIERVYDADSEKDSNVLEVYIRRLRLKIGEGMITTRRGQGYVFGEAA